VSRLAEGPASRLGTGQYLHLPDVPRRAGLSGPHDRPIEHPVAIEEDGATSRLSGVRRGHDRALNRWLPTPTWWCAAGVWDDSRADAKRRRTGPPCEA